MGDSSVPAHPAMSMVAWDEPSPGSSSGVAGGRHWACHVGIYAPVAAVGFLDGRWCDGWGIVLRPVPLASTGLPDAHPGGVDRVGDGLGADPAESVVGMD